MALFSTFTVRPVLWGARSPAIAYRFIFEKAGATEGVGGALNVVGATSTTEKPQFYENKFESQLTFHLNSG